MNCNVGNTDRIVRALAGIALIASWLLGWTEGTLTIIVAVIGILLLSTSALRFCPLYRLFGASTCR